MGKAPDRYGLAVCGWIIFVFLNCEEYVFVATYMSCYHWYVLWSMRLKSGIKPHFLEPNETEDLGSGLWNQMESLRKA